MAEEIIVTPWATDSEWQLVRQDIYANKEQRNYKRALRKLFLWKTRGKPLSRGLHCTELILQVITKDIHFCDVDNTINENDLVQLYSMAVMKFVNLTADVLGKGPQKSMYIRASHLELPAWLVDMRHRISHEQDLPTLNSLRKAMEFTLEWLQTKYWNVDENFQVVSSKLNLKIIDEFINLLEFYMLNKIKVDTISKEERLNDLRQKLSMPEFSNKDCTKQIKELLADKIWAPQLVNVFISRYLLQSKECNINKGRISKTDKSVWSVLLKIMTNSGLLTSILKCLVIQQSRIAALWVIELCLVVYKTKRNINIKHNDNDSCMSCKPLHLDTNLVLRTALNSAHKYTIVFLKWLLQVQSNPLKVKQQYNIAKLVTLYTGSVKINSKNNESIFTINDLMNKIKNQNQSNWSLAFDQIDWKQLPLGTTL